ncbi:Histidine kinase [Hymenobacter daecheongensis DSM 21074]|uniref:Histidine kinase n=1 Tax=Hymenobacter daecheongensis DSM 21074 TaxID=1121955 RepID=A0A1M6IXS9_9BACT|nr:Histidine kinase [Hymenobacter daecheongensis DSM 21074]
MPPLSWQRLRQHALWWLLPLLLEYYFISQLLKDNARVVVPATAVIFLQTILTYYWLGYFLFPRYLHRMRAHWLVGHIVVVFYAVYLNNYLLFRSLQPLSNGFGISRLAYVERIWHHILAPAGPLGCFTSLRAALWNYGFSLFIVTILLLIKFVRDITVYQTKNLRLERDRIALENSNLMLELNFLKSQINPHFLFNTLNSIYVQVEDTNERVAEQVLQLSDLMRYGLYESNTSQVELSRELDYINSYLQLEKSRYGGQADIQFERHDNHEDYHIAPLLLISFVENAFKHGVGRVKGGSFVHVRAVVQNQALEFSIRNSVPANGRPEPTSVGGVGLSNVRKRLELLYGGRHDLRIDAGPEQYAVRLRLQFAGPAA